MSGKMNAQILCHSLHETDVTDQDAHHLVFCLQEQGIFLVKGRETGGVEQFKLPLHLVGSPQDVAHAEGLEEVVDGIHLVALHGIFLIGSGEDHKGRMGQRAHEVKSVEVGHIDVDEDGIHLFPVQYTHRLNGTLATVHQLEERHFLQVCRQLAQCQRLIIYR